MNGSNFSVAEWREWLRATEESFDSTLREAGEKTAGMLIGATAPDRSVRVEVNGDFTLHRVLIREAHYQEMDGATLATTILTTYRQAKKAANDAQWQMIGRTFAGETAKEDTP